MQVYTLNTFSNILGGYMYVSKRNLKCTQLKVIKLVLQYMYLNKLYVSNREPT